MNKMAFTFKFPDVGEGMAEGEIVDWLVAEGDEVSEGDSVAEVQNDKSVEEIASPVSGTITSILVEAGTIVNVDQPIMVIDDGSGCSSSISIYRCCRYFRSKPYCSSNAISTSICT